MHCILTLMSLVNEVSPLFHPHTRDHHQGHVAGVDHARVLAERLLHLLLDGRVPLPFLNNLVLFLQSSIWICSHILYLAVFPAHGQSRNIIEFGGKTMKVELRQNLTHPLPLAAQELKLRLADVTNVKRG